MNASTITSSEDFVRRLQDGERWLEVVQGRLIRLSPPDEAHGNVVRNLSKSFGQHLRKQRDLYACFELGLQLADQPLMIYSPALACFRTENGFGELDQLLSTTVPELVVEVASSNDRRDAMSERVRNYQTWGVPHIWVFDPESQHVHVFSPNERPQMLKEIQTLTSRTLLPGWEMLVGDAFLDPQWARK
ncbi:hypothetical protein GC163_18855 [bacterium]|nr:hypothetical protein [bacterium]